MHGEAIPMPEEVHRDTRTGAPHADPGTGCGCGARQTSMSTEIRRVADAIARRFRPERIILFGSHARGTATADSDVDLLVIMDTAARPVDQAVAIREAVDLPFPADLLVRTPQQIEMRLAVGDPFITEIVREGVVLYEAAHP